MSSTRTQLLLIAVFALGVRLVTTPEVGTGGDALIKWWNGKVLLGVAEGEWEWSHHTARLGVMLPMLASQYLVGSEPVFYFVPTFAISIVQAMLMFAVASRVAGPAWGFWAAVALLLHPQMVISGAQLLPGTYSSTYLLACIWFLLGYRDARGGGTPQLLCAALAFFLAYLTKLSNALYVPGFGLALWGWQRRPRDLFIFAGAVASLIAMEFGLYRALAGTDRLLIIEQAGMISPIESWTDLFGRYAILPWFWQATLIAYGVAALALAAEAIRGRLDGRELGVMWLPASFLLGITFALRSLDPLVPAQAFFSRYFTSALPFFILVIVLFLKRLLERIPRSLAVRPRTAAGSAATLAALLACLAALRFPGYDEHPMVRLVADSSTVAEFASGTPVVSFDGRGWAATAWMQLYWNESAPDIRAARFGSDGLRGFWYGLADQSSPVRQQLETADYDGDLITVEARLLPNSDTLGFRVGHMRIDPELRSRLRGAE